MRSWIRPRLLALPLFALVACGSAATPEEQGSSESPVVADPLYTIGHPANCGALGQTCCVESVPHPLGLPTISHVCNSTGLVCSSSDVCIIPPPPTQCGYAGEACCEDGSPTNYDLCDDGISKCNKAAGPYGICAPAQGASTPAAPVMTSPKVVVVYWSTDYYTSFTLPPFGDTQIFPNPRGLICGQMLSDIVSPTYLTGLAQYGVTGASVVESAYMPGPPPAAGTHLTYIDMQNALIGMLNAGEIAHKPAVNDMSTLYFIMAPPDIELWPTSTTQKADGVQGAHYHTKYNTVSTRDDLIWATAKTYNLADQAAAGTVSDVVAHEVVEAFNDPIGGRLEIGDMCDGQNGGAPSPEYTLPGSSLIVPQYWSEGDLACIHGDQP
jgi:hypothetical protein